MLKHTTSRQLKMEFVCIGDLVPKDHLLRKISMAIGLDSPIYQDIFDEIVLQALRRGMVDGKTLYTDSTHLEVGRQ